jgi:putative SOS response-associated peptidase YedK
MCGRYTIFTEPQRLMERFRAEWPEGPWQPRYNAAPTQSLPVLLNDGTRRIRLLRWGLIPHWAEDPAIGNRLINARAETLTQRPSFREAFYRRRCLVLADGFYEWQRAPHGRIPYWIGLKDREPFAFAGLWDRWEGPDGQVIESFTIITTAANERVAPIHDRMPVILLPEHEDIWLDESAGPAAWRAALRPYPADRMIAYPVSPRVNTPTPTTPPLSSPIRFLEHHVVTCITIRGLHSQSVGRERVVGRAFQFFPNVGQLLAVAPRIWPKRIACPQTRKASRHTISSRSSIRKSLSPENWKALGGWADA